MRFKVFPSLYSIPMNWSTFGWLSDFSSWTYTTHKIQLMMCDDIIWCSNELLLNLPPWGMHTLHHPRLFSSPSLPSPDLCTCASPSHVIQWSQSCDSGGEVMWQNTQYSYVIEEIITNHDVDYVASEEVVIHVHAEVMWCKCDTFITSVSRVIWDHVTHMM